MPASRIVHILVEAVAVLLVASALVPVGCAGGAAPIRAGRPAPDWTLADAGGTVRSLSEFRGRVVLMDFWASWCSPCRRAEPAMEALAERFGGDGLVVLTFQHQDDADPDRYAGELVYAAAFFPDADKVADLYGAGLPSFIVVDREGTVALHQGGFNDATEAKLARVIEEQLAAPTGP